MVPHSYAGLHRGISQFSSASTFIIYPSNASSVYCQSQAPMALRFRCLLESSWFAGWLLLQWFKSQCGAYVITIQSVAILNQF